MNDTTRRTLESLGELRLPDLQARFAEVVGEPTRSPNKKFLLRRIGEALEAREREGDEITAPDAAPPEPAAPTRLRLTKLSVSELQARYRYVVGRDTGSSSSAYLVWKIRQAQRGRVRVGPVERRIGDGTARDVKVLPLRMTAAEVEELDAAWKRLGFKSRTEMLRDAVREFVQLRAETPRRSAPNER